jgi:hypothetical protein
MAQQPPVGQGLIMESSRSHSDTPHSVGFLWTSDQPFAETFTWQHTTLTRDRCPWPWRDFFFCLSGVFPLWSTFVLFKSFCPSCHFTFHTTIFTTNTTQTSMPPVGFDRAATGIGESLWYRITSVSRSLLLACRQKLFFFLYISEIPVSNALIFIRNNYIDKFCYSVFPLSYMKYDKWGFVIRSAFVSVWSHMSSRRVCSLTTVHCSIRLL